MRVRMPRRKARHQAVPQDAHPMGNLPPDETSALKVAIEEFGIINPGHQSRRSSGLSKRLFVRRVPSDDDQIVRPSGCRSRPTPGVGCSITSAATVSTTGATGCFAFCAAFFTGAGLGLAFATVRFVAFPRAAWTPCVPYRVLSLFFSLVLWIASYAWP